MLLAFVFILLYQPKYKYVLPLVLSVHYWCFIGPVLTADLLLSGPRIQLKKAFKPLRMWRPML